AVRPKGAGPFVTAARAMSNGEPPGRACLGPLRSRSAERWGNGEREALVELLAAGDRGSEWLLVLDAMDVLGRVLPEWNGVRGRPQRDPFHRFPVDAHLLRASAEMARIMHRPSDPFVSGAAALVDDVATPLLAALLHDAGKIGRRSHVPTGVAVAGSVLDRIGVPASAAGDVLFLVGQHLLLADTATRRDLQDEELIARTAAVVGDERRLALLYLVTVADAVATGPHAVTPWRLGLIKELVA